MMQSRGVGFYDLEVSDDNEELEPGDEELEPWILVASLLAPQVSSASKFIDDV